MKKKINLKPYIIAGIISIIIGTGVFLAFFLPRKNMYGAFNGTSFAAVILISMGGLSYVAKEGFFDFAGYGFRQLATMIFGRKPNVYNDYPSYRNYKNEIREKQSNYFISFLLIGLLFLIAFIILKLI